MRKKFVCCILFLLVLYADNSEAETLYVNSVSTNQIFQYDSQTGQSQVFASGGGLTKIGRASCRERVCHRV